MRRNHPVGIVNGRLDHVGVLDRLVDVGEVERLRRVCAGDLLVERHAMIASDAIGERRLVLVMAGCADLLVGAVPRRLRLLDRHKRARRRILEASRLGLLRRRRSRDTTKSNDHYRETIHHSS